MVGEDWRGWLESTDYKLIAETSLLDTSLKNTSNDFDDIPEPEDVSLPPKEDLQILLNRVEMQLPKDDHVKYDSRYTCQVK